ncbi:MAG: nucleotide exchange factor GrpE [Limnochordia bacterium]|nr:nucleotide exchange factor GrpE [Limnochordia bacterium]MDI9465078.1 nucleotide exchange factor GrpE [Bacillota bacterium]NLO95412.1 nucleotide exchange factor GrpE [Bacillota bacterium]HAN94285.1 nucleotide exchange factor GrpE [Bacillota bacterium]HOB40071.1 nucleotide exchange factor GrpE [Limnochordia bacterium]
MTEKDEMREDAKELEQAEQDSVPEQVEVEPGVQEAAEEQAEAVSQEFQEQLAQLEEERARLAQQLLRLKADFENYRRRMQRQLEGIRLAANEELIKDLLPVLDNFERAMQAKREEQAEDPFFQGMEMVFRGLQEALANHGLQPIEAVGQPFDPNLHEAVAMEGTGGEELSVLAQVQTGYLLHDKVLRHTKVLVGQGEEEEKQCQK